jgi:isorenieratene synthase
MRAEYLLFDLVVVVPPLLLSQLPAAGMAGRWRDALRAILLMAAPFVVWDALVVGRHWRFNAEYVLGPRIAGLPFEEVLFFFSMPFACLFTWQSIFAARDARPRQSWRPVYGLAWIAAASGVVLFASGREYTGLTLLACAGVAVWDRRAGTELLLQPRFVAFLGAVVGFTLLFNGYLTARPVVLYGEEFQLGYRIGTIPVEDFGYGIALVFGVVVGFEAARDPRRRGLLARGVERLFGGYRQRIDAADPALPREPAAERRVAVVGGGIAGLTAASTLGERRFRVTLYEENDYLGGKIGGWDTRLPDGSEVGIEHGFHAFFRHYYNLNAFLERIGATKHFVPIDDYLILGRDGRHHRFGNVSSVPFLNLLSMARHGIYRIRDVALGPAGREMSTFFRYDPVGTFAELDAISFAEFAERARLPARLRLVFSTFARAFFADADRLSMAELVKSFHSYYLSHDHGLLYDYPDGTYGETLIEPIQRHLIRHGVQVETGRRVDRVERRGEAFVVEGDSFDAVVLATHARATREILEASPFVAREDPELAARLPHLRTGQRYAMLRLWLDRDLEQRVPVFVVTEKIRVLDSVSVYHRISRQSAEWVREHGGGIFELHCYAVPDDLKGDDELRLAFLGELHRYFPELADAEIVHEVLQVRDDFAAFHVGMSAERPGHRTGIPGLYLAGDWVRLPCPVMLMEAACTAGLFCANAILEREGLCEERVESVPLRGLLAR